MAKTIDNHIKMSNRCKRWTPEEDSRLVNQVRAFPQNLNKCFTIVSELTGRSKTACAARWYGILSKRTENAAFFTVSQHSKLLNRKNGAGERSTESIFKRIMRILKFS